MAQCGVYDMVGWDVSGVYGCACDVGCGGVARTGEAYVAWRAFWRLVRLWVVSGERWEVKGEEW